MSLPYSFDSLISLALDILPPVFGLCFALMYSQITLSHIDNPCFNLILIPSSIPHYLLPSQSALAPWTRKVAVSVMTLQIIMSLVYILDA